VASQRSSVSSASAVTEKSISGFEATSQDQPQADQEDKDRWGDVFSDRLSGTLKGGFNFLDGAGAADAAG